MKLKNIYISNILSFQHKDDINDAQKISFDQNLNILIGPNGAGKSNFLEILNQLFKNILYRQCGYNEENIYNYNARTNPQIILNQTLIEANRFYSYLITNRKSGNPLKKIKVTLSLNDNDINNLKFIFDNALKISSIFQKYCNVGPLQTISTSFNRSDLDQNREIVLIYHDESIQNKFTLASSPANRCLTFIHMYFEYFEFFQKCIIIANKFESENWQSLKYTFALIGSYRSYNNFDPNYLLNLKKQQKFTELKGKDLGENTRAGSNEEPVAFLYVKNELAFEFNTLLIKYGKTKAKKMVLEKPFIQKINDLLFSYLKIKLDIDRQDEIQSNYTFYFNDSHNNRVEFSDLSAGQKSIIHFIFSLYGYDIEKGLLIIDEPELHLHPQMQEKFLDVINKVKDDLDLQFMIVTHSPVFINSSVIKNVYRFNMINGYTKVIHPTITEHDEELVRILTYTNSVKIFFSKKVVLVEGDSDEYFYRRFYEYYKNLKNKDPELEFLYIKGKGSRGLWKRFLDKYQVKSYFIGDWDNIVDEGIIRKADLNLFIQNYIADIYRNIQRRILSDRGSNDRTNLLRVLSNYVDNPTQEELIKLKELRDHMLIRYIPSKELITFIKNNNTVYTNITSSIESKYSEKVFILKEGELEDYLNINGKGLGLVINFCKNDFNSWIAARNNLQKVNEITSIFDKILK